MARYVSRLGMARALSDWMLVVASLYRARWLTSSKVGIRVKQSASCLLSCAAVVSCAGGLDHEDAYRDEIEIVRGPRAPNTPPASAQRQSALGVPPGGSDDPSFRGGQSEDEEGNPAADLGECDRVVLRGCPDVPSRSSPSCWRSP